MPVVTVDPSKTERFDLKTAPADPSDPTDENGWVELRALPYGMKLARRDKASRMSMRAQATKTKGQKTSATADGELTIENYNEWAVGYYFAYYIIDHNLTDSNKVKLDFSKAMSLKQLDPKVGSEIERLINELNEDEDEAMIEDFPSQSNTLSSIDSTDSLTTD